MEKYTSQQQLNNISMRSCPEKGDKKEESRLKVSESEPPEQHQQNSFRQEISKDISVKRSNITAKIQESRESSFQILSKSQIMHPNPSMTPTSGKPDKRYVGDNNLKDDSFSKESSKGQILEKSSVSEARYKLEWSVRSEDIGEKIDKIMEESKMKSSQKDQIQAILDRKKSVADVGKQLKGPSRKKFKERMYPLLRELSELRISNKSTCKQRQFDCIASQFGVDSSWLLLSQEELLQKDINLSKEEISELLERIKSINQQFKEKQEQTPNDQIKDPLIELLNSVQIDDADEIAQCRELLKEGKYEDLLEYPQEKYRQKLEEGLKRIMNKNKVQQPQIKQEKVNIKEVITKELVEMLKEAKLEDEEQIQECIDLYHQGNYQQIIEYPPKKYRKELSTKIDSLIKKENQLKEKEQKKLQQNLGSLEVQITNRFLTALKNADIKEQDQIQQCSQLFKNIQIEELKKYPSKKYRASFGKEIDEIIKFKENQESKVKKAQIKSKQQEKNKNLEKEFHQICQQVKIKDPQEIDQCFEMLKKNQISELKQVPKMKERDKFKNMIGSLMDKYESSFAQKQKEMEQKKQKSFRSNQSISKKLSDQSIESQSVLLSSERSFERINMSQEAKPSKIIESKQQQKQSVLVDINLKNILDSLAISGQQQQVYANNIINGSYSFIFSLEESVRRKLIKRLDQEYKPKSLPMKQRIIFELTPLISDEEINKIIQNMSSFEQSEVELKSQISTIVRHIEKQHQFKWTLKYSSNKQKKLSLNELKVANSEELKEKIQKLTKIGDLDEYEMFLNKQKIVLQQYHFEPHQHYIIELQQIKQYKYKYGGKSKKINLNPERSISYNKSLIWKQLISSKQIVYEQQAPANMDYCKLIFKIKEQYVDNYDNDKIIANIESQTGAIVQIVVQVMLKIKVFYEDIEKIQMMSSNSKIIDLRKILNAAYVPFKSQILNLMGQKICQIDESKDQQLLSSLSNEWNIVFELINRCSFQFYGFHSNIFLTFEAFSEFFVQNEEATFKLISNCSFGNKKEQQANFIQHFFAYLYSGIKKRFPIKTIIDKFKKYVSKIKYEEIWNPSSQNQAIKVNQAFVLTFMLKNSQARLRIQLMNLLKDNMTLPLFFKKFQNISKVSDSQYEPNNEILWILKEGFTIASIGLHNDGNSQNQKGKSSLLNEIFPVYFQQTQNKHTIIQSIPFIAVRVFQNICPTHVIDIPRGCSEQIVSQILKRSNLVMIHSWKSQGQSQQYIKRIKDTFKLPVICLRRDCKDNNSLKSLKSNCIAEEKPQKIINLSKKEPYIQQIAILKQEIFKFIEKKLHSNKQLNKILQIYPQQEIYKQFGSLLSVFENKMFDLAPIGKQMKRIKQLEKQYKQNEVNTIKRNIQRMIKPEIIKIIEFLLKPQVISFQSLLLSLLRQKLKTYQNQLNLKYVKIYELRDFFVKKVKGDNEQKRQNLRKLNQKLQEFRDLKPEDIIGKNDQYVEELIQKMIDTFQNIVKPEIFSVQLFWRQLSYLAATNESYEVSNKPIITVLKELKQIEINSSFPFQIIDGDLLQMPRKLMKKIFENKEDRAIVITVLGPQSSGKSTLLNFLFGCDFATSQGRCTRGVYGTYFKFAENRGYFNNMNHCQGIFVIDTEGLFALTNEKDKLDEDRKNFDSKLVLFCLAVSDFIVLNVRGNVDKNTEKIFRLCHQRLQDLNIDKQRRPQIVVVLNQNNSDRKEQSQNQFKQIKKTINFDIGISLSLAYQIRNYGHQQISLFGKNQKLTKKYPLQSFQKETSSLMQDILGKIMKKRNVSKLQQISQKFERIWSLVVAFPNLTKVVTNEYRQLERKIKLWKDSHDEQSNNELNTMLQDFRINKINEEYIMEQIKQNSKKIEVQYESQFKEHLFEDQDLKYLIRQQKGKLTSKALVLESNIKYQLENIKLAKQLKLSKIEGDFILKQKARQMMRNGEDPSQEKKRQFFDKYFQEQLLKIEMTTNLGQQIHRQYQTIYDNYIFLIREQTGSEKGLPKSKGWIGNDKCSLETMLTIIKDKIIEPNQQKYEDVLNYTNKEHTNILKGGKTDAALEYFNMRDYFKTENIVQYYTIKKTNIQKSLKFEVLKQLYSGAIEKANKKINLSQQLRHIWTKINASLHSCGIRFPKFQQFQKIYLWQEANIFSKIIDYIYLGGVKQEITYELFSKQNEQSNNSKSNKKRKLQSYQVDHTKHSFSPFLIQYLKDSSGRCLCSYDSTEPASFLRPKFYKHINWEKIHETVHKQKKFQHKISIINQQLTSLIKDDLKKINLDIVQDVNWGDVLFSQHNKYRKLITFSMIRQLVYIQSESKMHSLIQETSYFNHKELKNSLTKSQVISNYDQSYLPIFAIKTKKLESTTNKVRCFDAYLKNNTLVTIKQLKNSQFQEFIFEQIKHGKKRSLDKFFSNIFKIVQQVIGSWQKLQQRTYVEIYNRVNQQICKFNNDLNQISCNLSEKYIGYMHSAIIYMIWKLIIDQKIKQKREVYNAKKDQYQKQWELFKARTSRDEDNNVDGDIKEFKKQFITLVKERIESKKRYLMNEQKKSFLKTNSRDQIQDFMDMHTFSKNSTDQEILQYLEYPYDMIMNEYLSRYELSWRDLQRKYSTERQGKQILQYLYDLLICLSSLLQDIGIDDSKRNFSDIFEIVDKDIKVEDMSTTQEQYEHQGKRIIYEYLIDILLSQDPNKVRKCQKIQVKPIKLLNIHVEANQIITAILSQLRQIKHLSLTNFVKFVKKMVSPETKTTFVEEIELLSKMNEKDRLSYIDMIRVVVCNEKCPCCGRICGIENEHQHHSCVYGHQMRGLNGSHIKVGNGLKQASVVRCEQLAETDEIEYNGKRYTWCEFKDYWKSKPHGGWLYDDAASTKDTRKQIFELAWTIAGPIYCKQNGLQFVNFNKADAQIKGSFSGPIHYIFALDCSGSMGGPPWVDLLNSYEQTIQRIQRKDVNKNAKISTIIFDNKAILECENTDPASVNTHPAYRGGGTNFNEPFEMAATIAERYIDKAIVLFIFMTDGGARYPVSGMNSLRKLQADHPGKLRYSGIEFSSHVPILKTIAAELNGKTGVAFNAEELTDLFLKSIEVIEYRENQP